MLVVAALGPGGSMFASFRDQFGGNGRVSQVMVLARAEPLHRATPPLTGLTGCRERSFTAPEDGPSALLLVNWGDEPTEVAVDATVCAAEEKLEPSDFRVRQRKAALVQQSGKSATNDYKLRFAGTSTVRSAGDTVDEHAERIMKFID